MDARKLADPGMSLEAAVGEIQRTTQAIAGLIERHVGEGGAVIAALIAALRTEFRGIEAIATLPQRPGLYYFEYRLDASGGHRDALTRFAVEWNERNRSLGTKKSPAAYPSRIRAMAPRSDGWYPLYVGKRSDVKARVEQHWKGGSDATYGMRLRDRGLDPQRLRVSTVTFDLDDAGYDLIVPYLEATIHRLLGPLVGKA